MTNEKDAARSPRAPATRRGALAGALLAGAVALGWVVHDLAIFGACGTPTLTLEILPPALAAIGCVALVGLLLGARPRVLVPAVLVASAVLSLAPRLAELPFPRHHLLLPRALLFGTLLGLSAAWVARKLGRGALELGIAAGIVGSTAFGTWHEGWMRGSGISLLCALLLLFALFFLPRGARVLAMLVLVCLPPGYEISRVGRAERLERADLLPLQQPARQASGASERANLLLVVLDTVRASHLAPYGHERVTTPALDRFAAQDAVLYRNARSTTSWTLPSHASLFTGLMPSQHGATHPRSKEYVVLPGYPLDPAVPTLAEALRTQGWRTGAIVANSYALGSRLGLDRGFEHYDERRGGGVLGYLALPQLFGWRVRTGHVPYRDGRAITNEALRWIDDVRSSGPFFLALNYMDAHAPYLPASPYDRAFSDERPTDPLQPERELLALQYDRALLWLDSQLARLFEGLRERDLWEDTVIIVTSDHGESFGERGFWRHDWTLYDDTLKVPLYVKPAGARGETAEVETPLSGADVPRIAFAALDLPYLLPELAASVEAEWYFIEGAGLRAIDPGHEQGMRTSPPSPELRAKVTTPRNLLAWLEGSVKVIVSSTGEVEAYDLALDPEETRPLELPTEDRERWLQHARDWWQAHPPRVRSGSQASAEELEALRRQADALGYAGG